MQFPTSGTTGRKNLSRENVYENKNLIIAEIYFEDLSEARLWEESLNCVVMQFSTIKATSKKNKIFHNYFKVKNINL